jgi:hypothetical protein
MKTRSTFSLLLLVTLAGCPDSHGTDGDTGVDAPVPDSAVAADAGPGPRVTCGAALCDFGDVCCNESCGVCTAPGGACSAIACTPSCDAQEARGEGGCEAELGVVWRGSYCSSISGCSCVGADCGALYESIDACLTAHRDCERVCGGLTAEGVPGCLDAELCDYPDGSFCGGDDSSGVCVARPDDCLLPGGVPVCGCDGNDYDDECLAQLAGTDAARFGSCDD